MQSPSIPLRLVALLFALLLVPACGGGSGSPGGMVDISGGPDAPVGDTQATTYVTYFWLGAVQDALVMSQYPDWNRGTNWTLQAAHGRPNGEQRSYVQFFVPQLPAGSKVLEARINVYEDYDSGQNGPAAIQVGEAVAPWSAASVTWNNQPNPLGPLGAQSIGPFIRAGMWRTSGDIRAIIQRHVDDPMSNNGFVLNNTASFAFLRTFTGLDQPNARTASTLGTAPRLLIKVESTVPLSTANIGTTLPPNTELGRIFGFSTPILIYQISTGNGYPAAWDVGLF